MSKHFNSEQELNKQVYVGAWKEAVLALEGEVHRSSVNEIKGGWVRSDSKFKLRENHRGDPGGWVELGRTFLAKNKLTLMECQ